MATHLARLRTGDDEPNALDVQHAKRDIIGRCIYGVDINPMAVELCKVALWMEAMEPGKPFSYLDHHIQCGNSLLGSTPALLERGIPDDAFTAIEGDVKSRVSELKKQNKKERLDRINHQSELFEPPLKLGNLSSEFVRLNILKDGSLNDIRSIEERYTALVRGADYQNARLFADTWCAVFVWKKDDSDLGKLCPTERDVRKVESHAAAGLLPHVRADVERLRDQYQFFHWHLAFPDVFRLPGQDERPENELTGWSGGFDVVLGNPPWEKTHLNATEWFASLRPDIANARTAAIRDQLIESLSYSDVDLFLRFKGQQRLATGFNHFLRSSGRCPLSSRGDINTYAIFSETDTQIICSNGRAGFIVPSGLAFDETTKFLFQHLVDSGALLSLFDFENRNGIFSDVHRSYRFSLVTVGGARSSGSRAIDLQFFAGDVSDLDDETSKLTLSRNDIGLLNPNTKTCPSFRKRQDAEVTRAIYRRFPILVREAEPARNDWQVEVYRMFHGSGDSGLFQGFSGGTGQKAVYEAKCFHQFNHRYATFVRDYQYSTFAELSEPTWSIHTEHYFNPDSLPANLKAKMQRWYLTYRCISRATDERTIIAGVLPECGVVYSANIVTGVNASNATLLLSMLNSISVDYVGRQSVGGANVQKFVIQQLPIIEPHRFAVRCCWDIVTESYSQWISKRALELTYTAWDLEPFAQDCGYDGPPFRWDEEDVVPPSRSAALREPTAARKRSLAVV